MDRFRLLIEELSDEMVLDFEINEQNCVAFIADPNLFVQIELDESGENLFIISEVADMPAGAYREILLKECLKHNALLPPLYGTFSYIEGPNKLILQASHPIKEMRGESLMQFLNEFVPKALSWKEAIDHGHPLPTGVEKVIEDKPPEGGIKL
ncbi:MAG: CesT family type III secretion system chaperone [Simkaniaceae bacterium]